MIEYIPHCISIVFACVIWLLMEGRAETRKKIVVMAYRDVMAGRKPMLPEHIVYMRAYIMLDEIKKNLEAENS